MDLFDWTKPLLDATCFLADAPHPELARRLAVLEEALSVWVGDGLASKSARPGSSEIWWGLPEGDCGLDDIDSARLRVGVVPAGEVVSEPFLFVAVTLSGPATAQLLGPLEADGLAGDVEAARERWLAFARLAPGAAELWLQGHAADADEATWTQVRERALQMAAASGPSEGGRILLGAGLRFPAASVVGRRPQVVAELLSPAFVWGRMLLDEIAGRPGRPGEPIRGCPRDDLERQLLKRLLPVGVDDIHLSLRRERGLIGLELWLRQACGVCGCRAAVGHGAFSFGPASFGHCGSCGEAGAQPLAFFQVLLEEFDPPITAVEARARFSEAVAWRDGEYVGWEGICR